MIILHDSMYFMKTEITTVTERGQISIPASVRARAGWKPGTKLIWEFSGDNTVQLSVRDSHPAKSCHEARGFARNFRQTRKTSEWMKELREGER